MRDRKRLLIAAMTDRSTISELTRLRKDLDRYFVLMESPTLVQKGLVLLLTQGIWSVVTYRIGRWVRRDLKLPLVKSILKIVTFVVHFFVTIITKIEIGFDVEIGGGLYIGHAGYIIVNPNVILGSNCNISSGVVIGEGGRAGKRGSPVIGNRVYIAPGAKIFGPITIGDNVAVGANAVVNDSVPDDAVMAGVPAKIVNYKGSADFIIVRSSD